MTPEPVDSTAPFRRQMYGLLIVLSLGHMAARILTVDDPVNHRPFLSANDRSRWCTIRALVEHGTYAIDDVTFRRGWDTIDMVKHRGRDGQPHYYSSKPPLLATVLAGPYWLLHQMTGHTLGTHPYEMGRVLLLLYNGLPMLIYFVLLTRLAERYGTTDWGRVFMVAAGVGGTLLNPFAVVLNNHLPAAVSALISLDAALRIYHDGERRAIYFAIAGFFAALTAACELPALSYFCLLGLVLLIKAPRQTLLVGTPAALVVLVASFTTNYAAHNTWKPPYAQRQEGKDWETGNWYNYTYQRGGRVLDSYWNNRQGIDRENTPLPVYAFHALLGHHGVFSLTPIWLLSFWGLFLSLRPPSPLRLWSALTLFLSLLCFAFYLSPKADLNYGGMTCGLRWLFWFAPLWLLFLLPTADHLATSAWGRRIAYLLLFISVFSAAYPLNPWTHPWLMQWMIRTGWITVG